MPIPPASPQHVHRGIERCGWMVRYYAVLTGLIIVPTVPVTHAVRWRYSTTCYESMSEAANLHYMGVSENRGPNIK